VRSWLIAQGNWPQILDWAATTPFPAGAEVISNEDMVLVAADRALCAAAEAVGINVASL
jgi:hypothetical protein